MSKPLKQGRRWCFTFNNYDGIPQADEFGDHMTYVIFGEEVGESGTPHLQGYVEFDMPVRPGYVLGLLPAHWENAVAGQVKNVSYCSKGHTIYEYGTRSRQGERNDINSVKAAIDNGARRAELYEDYFNDFSRMEKFLNGYMKHVSKPRDWMMTIILFVGPTGTGKSRTAHTLAKAIGSVYKVPATKGSGLYFDGYDGQDVCLIDEMDGNRCTPTFLNELCDRYEFSVPIHGSGNVQFASKVIIICSNYMPRDWWRKHNISSFERRVTKRVFFRSTLKQSRKPGNSYFFINSEACP